MASPFWKYFHDTLHWPQIFHPGPLSAMAKGLALYMDGVRDDILWLRRQWSPAKADEELIERYGASRGIYRQHFDTDQSFRARVLNAYAWHHLGGKVRGLERIFAENGLEGTEVLPASLPELWAHFRLSLDVTGTSFTADSAALSWWLANEYKPARSRLEYFLTKASIPLEERVAVGLCSRTAAKSGLWFVPPAPVPLSLRTGMAVTGGSSSKHRIWFPVPQPVRASLRTASCVSGCTSSRLALHFPPTRRPVLRQHTALTLAAITSSTTATMFSTQE